MKGNAARRNSDTVFWQQWGQYLAIAAAYAATYEIARHLTYSHWALTAGLRLTCLLLVPFRFWPALALGEALPTAKNALLAAPDLGMAWAVSASIPMIVLLMGCMKPIRLHWTLYDDRNQVRVELLLGVTLVCALATASSACLTLLTVLLAEPGQWPHLSLLKMFWAYVLGAYLGALTLAPISLALIERSQHTGPITLESLWRSSLLRDAVPWTLVTVALIWLAISTGNAGVRQCARLGLLLPMIALARRHGWHGTALGGFGASVAAAMTGAMQFDAAMIRVQVILSLVFSGLLLIGAGRGGRSHCPGAENGHEDTETAGKSARQMLRMGLASKPGGRM